MNKSRFLPMLLAAMLSSCVENPIEESNSLLGETGLLQIGLSIDENLEIVQTRSQGLDPSLVPAADDFYVELYRLGKKSDKSSEQTWNRLYFGTYAEAKEMTMRVNAGDWKLLAYHGDSTACGFDKPYFKAEESFVVDGGVNQDGDPNITRVEAEAIVSNVWVSVNFDESVSGSFYDYFVRLTNLDDTRYRQILRYRKGDTRPAFMMPAKNLKIEFMAQYEYGDEDSWRYAVLDTMETFPNDHLNINLAVNPRHGKLDVNITTDETVVMESEEVDILEVWAPQEAPSIVAAGFPGGDHSVVEGDRAGNNAAVSVLARGGLKNFFVKIESDFLNSNGFNIPVGEEIDLADQSEANREALNRLADAGLSWQRDMLGTRKLTYMTMTDFFTRINEMNTSLTVPRNLATFTLRVVDQVNKTTEQVLTVTAQPITQTLVLDETDVWATFIASPKLKVERGVTSLYTLQVSRDGQVWTDWKKFETADMNVLDFGTLDTEPATTYMLRTIYNDNPDLVSNVVTVTTESALQVGNRGFEDYQTLYFPVSVQAGDDYEREWYLPYKAGESDPWWAVNSKMTMPSSHSISNVNFKNFPCTGYSVDRYEGEKSAVVFTTNVNWWNTDGSSFGDNVPGEIWIGKADDSGNHISEEDGHAFTSRPSGFRFHYKYNSLNNETFVVTLVIKDASGNEIARIDKTDGRAATSWSLMELPIVYSDSKSKAASIYMSFKSCAGGDISMNKSIELAGVQQKAHIGSVLRIDNIELTY